MQAIDIDQKIIFCQQVIREHGFCYFTDYFCEYNYNCFLKTGKCFFDEILKKAKSELEKLREEKKNDRH